MKLLHTSDWHLGLRLGRNDRTPDQSLAMKALIDIAQEEKPDLIVHSGDLFDSSRPPYEPMRLGVRALARLSAVAPTVVIAGNHDSLALFRVLHDMAGIAHPRRLWFIDSPEVLEIPQLGDGFALTAVPFIPPSLISSLSIADLAKLEGNYADGVRSLNTHLLAQAQQIAGNRGIVTYTAHLHVAGARPGKSEKVITVGEDYTTTVESLGAAMYSAFGHIHDPQLLPGGLVAGRYAGSLVPIDFGERTQGKHAVIVELGDDVRVTERPLPGGRPLHQFEGSLEQLEADAAAGKLDGTLLKARVQSADPIADLADLVAAWAPDCDIFDLANVVANQPVKAITATEEAGDAPPIEDLFAEWRSSGNARKRNAPDAAVVAAFSRAMGDGVERTAGFGTSELVTAADTALKAFSTDGEEG
ncbi:Exonuclease SbcD [Euzebya pacifica]|uniref:Nuclease SbcCD subunit D n=1 Tax=Euzebya pacifica TaxID=1608957 RepID=A0A346XRZ2_9ACTN|nr:exonuclease SbcCD subunit D [Euzebya pacifica]AXV04989.1 Exonuclease SbcD [Euzebya pacifica]